MRKKYKRLLFIIALAIIVVLVLVLILKFYRGLNKDTKIKVIEKVENFEYVLEDRDTVIYKNIYQELKHNLESENIDQAKYAEQIAELFIIDLFTLDNKLSSYDVGGVDFVYPDAVANYKLNVEDTLYKYMENNADGKRKQNLPIVAKITVESNEQGEFSLKDETIPCYVITLAWDYEKDLGYDKKATVKVIAQDEKLYVGEYAVIE